MAFSFACFFCLQTVISFRKEYVQDIIACTIICKMKYNVQYLFNGEIDLEVSANSPEEAVQKFWNKFPKATMDNLSITEANELNICDKDWNFICSADFEE